MICYKEGSAGGEFNQFMAHRHLEEVGEFIQARAAGCIADLELPAAILGYIRLDRSRALNVSGDTLFFCCTFDCGFLECPEQNIDDA